MPELVVILRAAEVSLLVLALALIHLAVVHLAVARLLVAIPSDCAKAGKLR